MTPDTEVAPKKRKSEASSSSVPSKKVKGAGAEKSKRSERKAEKGGSPKEAEKHEDEVDEESAKAEALARRKAKQSRKSSAYHQAKSQALKEGKSAEEANVLGRKVPCLQSYRSISRRLGVCCRGVSCERG